MFQKISNKGQKMTTFPLSNGENIILEKIESISDVDNKVGFKGSLYEFTIYMDSGREINISNENNLLLIKEQESLIRALTKLK